MCFVSQGRQPLDFGIADVIDFVELRFATVHDTSMADCLRSTPLSLPDRVVCFEPYPYRFPAAQYLPLEREAPQGGLFAYAHEIALRSW